MLTESESVQDIKNSDIRNKIIKEFKKLKYNFSYKGTKYLIDTICIIYNLKEYYDYNLEKNIYPLIAKIHKTSVNNVKCNITNATDKMCYDCDEKFLMNYLGDYKFTKPGPKKIIIAVLRRI